MKTASIALGILLALAACTPNDDGPGDLGADCYNGEDMAWLYGALLKVRDATSHATLASPSFTVNGVPEYARCFVAGQPYGTPDLSTGICDTWDLDRGGNYTVIVHVDGYVDTAVDIDHDYTLSNGCPASRQVEATVELQPTGK